MTKEPQAPFRLGARHTRQIDDDVREHRVQLGSQVVACAPIASCSSAPCKGDPLGARGKLSKAATPSGVRRYAAAGRIQLRPPFRRPPATGNKMPRPRLASVLYLIAIVLS